MDDHQRYILNQIRKFVEQRFPSIQEAFMQVDTDRSGCISFDEFATILKINNIKVDREDLKHLVELFDVNQDGRVSYDDFCRAIESGPRGEIKAPMRQAAVVNTPPPASYSSSHGKPHTPRMGLQLNRSAMSEARAKELLTYFRKAVEQSFPSLQRAFIHIDADRSGYISAQELITLLYDHNIYPTWQELKDLIELLDVNGDGVIDYNEFGRAMHGRVGPASPDRQGEASPRGISGSDISALHRAVRKWCTQQHDSLRDAFRRINVSRTGAITEPELGQAISALVRHADPAAIQSVFDKYDLNHDGLVQYNEFVKAMSYDTL